MNADSSIAKRFSANGASDARAPSPRQGLLARLRAEPLLPEAGAAGAPLTAAIGVMSFLAALALAGLLLIFAASSEWTSELQSGVTIQIKGPDAAEIDQGAKAAMSVLQSTEGVLDARLLSREETGRLLEPWLGKGNIGDYLNVPALIEAQGFRILPLSVAHVVAAADLGDLHADPDDRMIVGTARAEALVWKGIVVGALFSFLTSIQEASATIFLTLGGWEMMPFGIFTFYIAGSQSQAAALGVILIVMCALSLYVVNRIAGTRVGGLFG